MSNSTGKFALSALRVRQPTRADGFMIVARDLLQGVEALSALQSIPPRSCALLAAHALECTLKAFLSHKGEKTKTLINVGHNLESLWNRAYEKKTLSISKEPPDWVNTLSSGHGPKFYFRYQEGEKDQKGERTVVHGGQTPALIPMAVELKKLIEMVGLAIKS